MFHRFLDSFKPAERGLLSSALVDVCVSYIRGLYASYVLVFCGSNLQEDIGAELITSTRKTRSNIRGWNLPIEVSCVARPRTNGVTEAKRSDRFLPKKQRDQIIREKQS
jgi:hypothetical protein